jgi:hypothetical protein
MFACLGGCTKPGDRNPAGKRANQGDASDLARRLAKLDSASHYLTIGDLDKFQPGRSKSGILKDVQWRGEFNMATEYKGKVVSAIIFELVPDDSRSKGGVWIWAIFVDDKFVKFVEPPPSLPGDMEVVNVHGTPWSRVKPLTAGDNRFLVRALDGKPVLAAELTKEVKSLAAPPHRRIDPGLTVAYLLLRAMGAAPAPDAPASEQDYLKNAALRDQFNAARLDIGMTEREVGATLKAQSLESGQVGAGSYRIYGSNESFNINDWLHFSNVLVVSRDGKAIVISSVPAGYNWRQKLRKATVDLPVTPRP